MLLFTVRDAAAVSAGSVSTTTLHVEAQTPEHLLYPHQVYVYMCVYIYIYDHISSYQNEM